MGTDGNFGGTLAFVVFVEAQERFTNAVVGEQHAGVAGILTAEAVNILQNTEGPARDIFPITDGQTDKCNRVGDHGMVRLVTIFSAAERVA